jgi:hypothetical protein
MKNRSIQFKPTAGVLIPLLLACFAAVFISIPTPAAAGGMVPFKGVVSGNIPADFATNPDYFVEGNPCLRDFFVSNSGIATQLGAFAGIAEFIPNLCDGSFRFLLLDCSQWRRNLRKCQPETG